MNDLLIRGGLVVTASSKGLSDIRVRDGKIVELGTNLEGSGDVLDATGHLVMPGGIDTHVHLHHPIDRLGIRTADDFFSGTTAGACGGVTAIIDFSLQRSGDSLLAARDRRLEDIEPNAVIDYSFHTIITDARAQVLSEMAELIDDGFPSFKIYMTYADKIVHDDALIRVMETAADQDGLVYLHCENDCAVTHLIQQNLSRGNTTPEFHAQSRPPEVEAEATNRAIMLAGLTGAPICIAHVTSADAAAHVARARQRSQVVVCETCPQYLVLTEDVYSPEKGFETSKFVCSPPIRAAEHKDALWRGLESGTIQQLASDHAPFRFEGQKTQGRDDFTKIPNGVPGIETRLPLLYTEGVKRGRISLEQFVELTSTNPAKIFGMFPKKGTLEVGSDADIIIVHPDKKKEVDASCLHSSIDYNPIQGCHLSGFPSWTISRGGIIVESGEPTAERGRGALVPRSIDIGQMP